jgi:hypothetical protein
MTKDRRAAAGGRRRTRLGHWRFEAHGQGATAHEVARGGVAVVYRRAGGDARIALYRDHARG